MGLADGLGLCCIGLVRCDGSIFRVIRREKLIHRNRTVVLTAPAFVLSLPHALKIG